MMMEIFEFVRLVTLSWKIVQDYTYTYSIDTMIEYQINDLIVSVGGISFWVCSVVCSPNVFTPS